MVDSDEITDVAFTLTRYSVTCRAYDGYFDGNIHDLQHGKSSQSTGLVPTRRGGHIAASSCRNRGSTPFVFPKKTLRAVGPFKRSKNIVCGSFFPHTSWSGCLVAGQSARRLVQRSHGSASRMTWQIADISVGPIELSGSTRSVRKQDMYVLGSSVARNSSNFFIFEMFVSYVFKNSLVGV